MGQKLPTQESLPEAPDDASERTPEPWPVEGTGPQLLTQQLLAELLDVSPRTLERWRVEGTGPPFCRAGRKPVYLWADVQAWLLATRTASTSEAPR